MPCRRRFPEDLHQVWSVCILAQGLLPESLVCNLAARCTFCAFRCCLVWVYVPWFKHAGLNNLKLWGGKSDELDLQQGSWSKAKNRWSLVNIIYQNSLLSSGDYLNILLSSGGYICIYVVSFFQEAIYVYIHISFRRNLKRPGSPI